MKIEGSNATGTSVVGRFNVRYTIQYDNEGNPKSATANIYNGINVVGTANMSSIGEFGISMRENAEMTASERSEVVSKIVDDFNEVFAEVVSDSASE